MLLLRFNSPPWIQGLESTWKEDRCLNALKFYSIGSWKFLNSPQSQTVRSPNSLNVVVNLRTIIHKSQPNSLITLTFRSHLETFILLLSSFLSTWTFNLPGILRVWLNTAKDHNRALRRTAIANEGDRGPLSTVKYRRDSNGDETCCRTSSKICARW